MDTFIYRIRTDDGTRYICEVQQEDDSWERVSFQYGTMYLTENAPSNLHGYGEYFKTEKELVSTIEDILGKSARRVREWRTV